MLPCHEDEYELPHLPAPHVVKIHKEKTKPDHRGDIALQHDDGEQQPTEHGAYVGCAQDPEVRLK